MYHRVGPEIEGWSWSNSLTVSAATFEGHLRRLKKSRYYTASLEELHAHMKGEQVLPERSVVLTVDDGYVDNWSSSIPEATCVPRCMMCGKGGYTNPTWSCAPS
jgi:peptidoglycan/xylan/chitin deacetylase (PgdA/CDA1 family)